MNENDLIREILISQERKGKSEKMIFLLRKRSIYDRKKKKKKPK